MIPAGHRSQYPLTIGLTNKQNVNMDRQTVRQTGHDHVGYRTSSEDPRIRQEYQAREADSKTGGG